MINEMNLKTQILVNTNNELIDEKKNLLSQNELL